jgi:hypothetical protein
MEEDLTTCRSGEPTPDGSNSSNSRVVRSSMKEARLLELAATT